MSWPLGWKSVWRTGGTSVGVGAVIVTGVRDGVVGVGGVVKGGVGNMLGVVVIKFVLGLESTFE